MKLMKIRSAWLIGGIIAIIFSACSKKTTPSSGTAAKKPDSAYVKNPAKIKTAVPKVIVVNDNAASKTFDGRYYYDLAAAVTGETTRMVSITYITNPCRMMRHLK